MRLGSRKKNRKMAARIRNARPTAALKTAGVMTARAAAPPMKGQPEGSIRTNGTLHQVTNHNAQLEPGRHEATESSVSLWLRLSMCRDKCDRTEPWSLRPKNALPGTG